MKQFLTFYFFLLISISAFAQSSKNSVQLELGGHGLYYSINYERIVFDLGWTKTTAQIGISYYGKTEGAPIPLWMPVTINQLFLIRERQFIEIGGGLMLLNDGTFYSKDHFEDDYQFRNIVLRLGYRLHSKNGKWIFRGGYTPIIIRENYYESNKTILEYHSWAGLAVGYRF